MKTKPFIALFVLALSTWNTAVGQEYIEVTVTEVGRIGEPFGYFSIVDNGEVIEPRTDFGKSRIGQIKDYLDQGFKIQHIFPQTTAAVQVNAITLKTFPTELQPYLKKATFTGRSVIYILYKE